MENKIIKIDRFVENKIDRYVQLFERAYNRVKEDCSIGDAERKIFDRLKKMTDDSLGIAFMMDACRFAESGLLYVANNPECVPEELMFLFEDLEWSLIDIIAFFGLINELDFDVFAELAKRCCAILD